MVAGPAQLSRSWSNRAAVSAWVEGYERAWRTAGTDALATLFTDDATYSMDPYRAAVAGRAAIDALWDRERAGPDEPFTMTWELVAVEGDTGVVRVEVAYHDSGNEFRDLWLDPLRRRRPVLAPSKSGRSGPTRIRERPARRIDGAFELLAYVVRAPGILNHRII